MRVRAGMKPAPTGEHGAFCNSPVGATLVVALPHNKNFNSFRENKKLVNNQMVATKKFKCSAKARA
jgi:hypothetical protein